jgi:transcriptional regulator with XRE-family HTH domain
MNERSKLVAMRIGVNLRRLKQLREMSTEQLAKASSLDPGQIELLLRGEGDPAADTLFLLAGALGVSPGEVGAGIAWIPDGEGGGVLRIDEPENE